jgi:hypothetical protein
MEDSARKNIGPVLVTVWHHSSSKTEMLFDPDMGYDVLIAQIESILNDHCAILLNGLGLELSEYKNDVFETISYDPQREAHCLDIFCVFPVHRDASGACSRQISGMAFGDENLNMLDDLIQPLYKVVDTDIRLCSHCASKCLDPSLLVYEPHAIQAFSCQSHKAVEFGMLPTTPSHLFNFAETKVVAKDVEIDRINETKVKIRANHPVNIYFKRCLMSSAIIAQTSGGFIGQAPQAFTSPLAAGQLAEQLQSQGMFTKRLHAARQTTLAHEEESHQQAARAAVDYACVLREAQLWQDEQTAKGKTPAADAVFLAGLLAWFKRHFFKWCNKPLCRLDTCPAGQLTAENAGKCADDMSSVGMLPPTADELDGAASRVEGYTCRHCNTITRFPRFNNPSRLLQTRTGRCGEWANCFGLICRSLGLDSRYVLDFTDHVWIEVWLDSEGRYCHCDPCENCLDAPLIYEHGWGKKLTYVLSVSRHGCVDSTAKYSRQLSSVLERRGARGSGVQEGWARQEISAADEQLRTSWKARTTGQLASKGHLRGAASHPLTPLTPLGCPMEALKLGAHELWAFAKESSQRSDELLEHRSMCLKRELAALTMRTGSGDWKLAEMLGRVSGDEKWRRARGELGEADAGRDAADASTEH